MTLISDGQGNTLGKVGSKIIRNPLPVAAVTPGTVRPCMLSMWGLGRYAKRNSDYNFLENEDGMLVLDGELLAQLDTYTIAGIELIQEFEKTLNRVSELAVNMAYYNAIHGEISAIELLSGIEEMRNAALKSEEIIRDDFPSEYKREMKETT
jgi:hypothetical protein